MVMVADFQNCQPRAENIFERNKKRNSYYATPLRISTWLRILDPNLQTLVHKQFASPKYVEMWKYSWFKTGYLDEHPQEFLNPVDYCFGKRSGLEKCSFCEQTEFIRCSFCEKLLCFTHFWDAVDGLGQWCAGETVR